MLHVWDASATSKVQGLGSCQESLKSFRPHLTSPNLPTSSIHKTAHSYPRLPSILNPDPFNTLPRCMSGKRSLDAPFLEPPPAPMAYTCAGHCAGCWDGVKCRGCEDGAFEKLASFWGPSHRDPAILGIVVSGFDLWKLPHRT